MTTTVRVNTKIKNDVTPILDSLGISLSEAVNMFLHQVKAVHGMPFELKAKLPLEINDGYGSYICEYGHVHDYSPSSEMGKYLEKVSRGEETFYGPYESVEAMMADFDDDEDVEEEVDV